MTKLSPSAALIIGAFATAGNISPAVANEQEKFFEMIRNLTTPVLTEQKKSQSKTPDVTSIPSEQESEEQGGGQSIPDVVEVIRDETSSLGRETLLEYSEIYLSESQIQKIREVQKMYYDLEIDTTSTIEIPDFSEINLSDQSEKQIEHILPMSGMPTMTSTFKEILKKSEDHE